MNMFDDDCFNLMGEQSLWDQFAVNIDSQLQMIDDIFTSKSFLVDDEGYELFKSEQYGLNFETNFDENNFDKSIIKESKHQKTTDLSNIQDTSSVYTCNVKHEEVPLIRSQSTRKANRVPKFSGEHTSSDKSMIFTFIKRRWGKEEDRKLFQKLRDVCMQQGLEISQFLIPYKDLSFESQEVLKYLKISFDWKGSSKDLLYRIHKVGNNKGFSARDTKLLRKLILAQSKNQGGYDFKSLEYYFPGKSSDDISAEIANKQY